MGKTIRELREAHNWSQFELAVKVGVTPQTVLNWEHGRREPKASQFKLLGNIFGVPLEKIDLIVTDEGKAEAA